MRSTQLLVLSALIFGVGCGDDSGSSPNDAGTDTDAAADAAGECSANETRTGSAACGINGRGTLTQMCESGTWVDGTSCEDSDACTDGDQRFSASVCGAGDVGFFYDDCTAGAWVTSASCSCGANVASETDYTIDSLADLNALSGVTQISGRLQIENPSIVGDYEGVTLSALQELRCIGELWMVSSDIKSIAGLANLTHVETGVRIEETGLTTLEGLAGLRTVGGELEITYNEQLTSLVGLPESLTLGLGFRVSDNPLLTSLVGMEGITEIFGDANTISYNETLSSLTGLENLARILRSPNNPGDLEIARNPLLLNLEGLSGLTELEGTLEVSGNDGMTSFAGLGLVSSPEGSLILESPSALTLAGMDEIVELDNLNVRGDALQSLVGFAKLKTIHGDLSLRSSLASGFDMPLLETIGGELKTRLPSVQLITGLDSLTTIAGNIDMRSAVSLTSLSGFSGITSLGGFILYNANQLTSLDGLPDNITAFTGDLDIRSSSGLTDFGRLSGLTTIGGYLFLDQVPITSLNDLSMLQTIGTFVRISDNPNLTKVTSLSALTTVTGALYISDNPSLPACDVAALVDSITIGGDVTTNNNTGSGVCL